MSKVRKLIILIFPMRSIIVIIMSGNLMFLEKVGMVLHSITAILTQSKVFLVDKPLHTLQMYSFHMKDIAISKVNFK